MRGRSWLWVVGVVAGCFHSRAPAIESARQADIAGVRDLAMAKLIMPSCRDDSTEFGPPSTRQVPGHMQVRQSCGLVSQEVFSTTFIATFIAQVCNGADSEACGAQLHRTFLARLHERYAFADWAAVANKCDAYPVDCKAGMSVELWALDSHNDRVVKWAQDAMAQTNDRYAVQFEQAYAEEAQHRRAVAAGIQAFGAAMAPPPTVHCTSSSIGTTTTTNCN